jgi:hypothetical protein
MKAPLLLPVLASLALRVLANTPLIDTPPACLLQAVNTQEQPGNLTAVCGKEATDVQKAIASMCSSSESAAQSAFISTCSAAGSSVGECDKAKDRVQKLIV